MSLDPLGPTPSTSSQSSNAAPASPRSRAESPSSSSAAVIRDLNHSVGNRAVTQLLGVERRSQAQILAAGEVVAEGPIDGGTIEVRSGVTARHRSANENERPLAKSNAFSLAYTGDDAPRCNGCSSVGASSWWTASAASRETSNRWPGITR